MKEIRTQESTANLIDEEYKLFHQADTNNLTSSSKFADSCVLTLQTSFSGTWTLTAALFQLIIAAVVQVPKLVCK